MASLNVGSCSYSIERVKDIILPNGRKRYTMLELMINRINVYKYEKYKSEYGKEFPHNEEPLIGYLGFVEDATLNAEMFMNGETFVEGEYTEDGSKKEKIKEEDELEIFKDLFEFYIPKGLVIWLVDEKHNRNKFNEVLIDEFFRLEDDPNEKTKEDK